MILTHWSVAQAGLNDEKTRGRKSRWIVPLKITDLHGTITRELLKCYDATVCHCPQKAQNTLPSSPGKRMKTATSSSVPSMIMHLS